MDLQKALEKLDLQSTLVLQRVLADRALYLHLNPPEKKVLVPEKKIII